MDAGHGRVAATVGAVRPRQLRTRVRYARRAGARPARIGKDGNTFRMDARLPGLYAPLKAIAFGKGDWTDKIAPGDEVDIAYTPQINEWNGRVSVELMLKDLRPT